MFPKIKSLFCEWVSVYLGKIQYDGIKKSDVATVISEADSVLTFNYTMTLEEAYDVRNACHIHGKIGDSEQDIFFGHGDKDGYHENLASIGTDHILSDLKSELRKDTNAAIERHKDFFNSLNDIETIHSYGFSFADVDLIYVKEIAERVDLNNVIWYLNKWDSRNSEIILKLEDLGFKVEVDSRWRTALDGDMSRKYTLTGHYVVNDREYLPIYSGKAVANADLFLYQVYNGLDLDDLSWGYGWFPQLYVYAEEYDSMWKRLTSKRFCEKIMPIFGVATVDELKERISKCVYDRKCRHSGAFDAASAILTWVKLEDIGTLI